MEFLDRNELHVDGANVPVAGTVEAQDVAKRASGWKQGPAKLGAVHRLGGDMRKLATPEVTSCEAQCRHN